MLLPLTYHLDATSAVVMLAGIYYGSQYGGSTAAILLNLPGTAGAAIVLSAGPSSPPKNARLPAAPAPTRNASRRVRPSVSSFSTLMPQSSHFPVRDCFQTVNFPPDQRIAGGLRRSEQARLWISVTARRPSSPRAW
jgi:hypothetical protein